MSHTPVLLSLRLSPPKGIVRAEKEQWHPSKARRVDLRSLRSDTIPHASPEIVRTEEDAKPADRRHGARRAGKIHEVVETYAMRLASYQSIKKESRSSPPQFVSTRRTARPGEVNSGGRRPLSFLLSRRSSLRMAADNIDEATSAGHQGVFVFLTHHRDFDSTLNNL
nr:unnamed protein product [Digitaria exilis]